MATQHWRATLDRYKMELNAEKQKYNIDVQRHSESLKSIENEWPSLERAETMAIHNALMTRMDEAETAIRDVQRGVTRAFDLVESLITFADKTIAEIERRDRIGALRQIAIACKKKFIRRVGGDRLDIWYKNVCPQSFKHLEEKVIRKYCTPDDADYFLKRVEDLKAEFGITDLDRLHRGYKSCTDDLHGEFHKVYDLE